MRQQPCWSKDRFSIVLEKVMKNNKHFGENCSYRENGLGSNIGHGLFVGWVEHPDIFRWVSFLYPTYLPAIFVLSAKPNKMAEDRTIPEKTIDVDKPSHLRYQDSGFDEVNTLSRGVISNDGPKKQIPVNRCIF